MSERTVLAVYAAIRDDVGNLLTRRPLPNREVEQIDPFLFLNHHGPQVYPPGNRGLPFGPHPHRGFETVTFILAGSLVHRDSGGHESVIETGGVQWMTAGRGLVHAELSPPEFLEHGGPMEILQLWVNLPARLKMTEPRYTGLRKEDIPAITNGAATVNLIAGTFDGLRGPVDSITGVFMTTIEMQAGGRISMEAPGGRNVFLYVVRGEVKVGTEVVPQLHLVELSHEGDSIALEALARAVVLFGHADPTNEPVFAYGPFVMNTQEEIVQAIRDYEAGRFG